MIAETWPRRAICAYIACIMLRVIQCQSAEGAKSYYSRSDYLSEGQELIGRWGGRGAKQLGLSGEVDKASFDRLCDNQDPRSGDRLTLRNKSNRTVGYDFNFHAPKGVSLAYLVGGDERVLEVFQQSVEDTMLEIERDSMTRVRKDNRQEERQTGNLVWGGFDHFTTREVDGEVDPHLHGHRMVFNITWDKDEEAWKAVQFRELKRDASYYEAAFHARLASGMKQLGYGIKRDGRDWDVAGFSKPTLEKFSRRTQQIEELARELGIENDKDKDGLGATSRVKKSYGSSLSELQQRWLERLDVDEVATLEYVTATARQSAPVAEIHRESEAMGFARLHCFERDSVVPKRKVLTEALRFGLGDVNVDETHRQYEQHRMITRTMDGRQWATTPEILIEEADMLAWAKDGKRSEQALNSSWTIRRDWLNEDQRRAIGHILTSNDRLIMLRGGAGTGKTALMKEAIDGIEAAGKHVFSFAPSAEASRGVLAKEGIEATTVAELLVNQDLQKSLRNNVVWIDEAGLLGTRTLKRVMDIADEQNARVVLSGDWRQHGSVEAGAAMRLLEQQGGIAPALVKKIQRQDGEYREAVALLAEGRSDEGLEALDRLGWVHEIENRDERMDLMATRYANGVDAGETVLAVAPTHAEADLLHDRIRKELQNREIVGSDEREFEQLKPLRFTEAEKSDSEQLGNGDLAVFHQKSKEFEKDSRIEINSDNAPGLTKYAKRFEVYRRQKTRLSKGDLVRITRNGKTKDKKHSLNNGSVYRIKSFNKQGDLVLDNGWTIDRNYGFIGSGYVSTSHASQARPLTVC